MSANRGDITQPRVTFDLRWKVLLLAVATWFGAARVQAEEQPQGDVSFRYAAPAGCPHAEDFRQTLEGRLGRPVEVAFSGRRLDVSISRAANEASWLGRLTLTDTQQVSTTRAVEGESCAAVVEALSLVAAVGGDGVPPDEPPDASSLPAVSLTLEERPDGAEDTPVTSLPPDENAVLRLGPVLSAVVDGSLAPSPAAGMAVGATFEWPRRGRLRPLLLIEGALLRSRDDLAEGAVAAQFEALAAGATFCPLQLAAYGRWSLRPCASVELGRLTGSGAGRALVRRTERHAFWSSAGLSLRTSLALWGPLELSASLGAALPLVRHEFFFSPDTLAFRVPPVGWRGAGSLAVMF